MQRKLLGSAAKILPALTRPTAVTMNKTFRRNFFTNDPVIDSMIISGIASSLTVCAMSNKYRHCHEQNKNYSQTKPGNFFKTVALGAGMGTSLVFILHSRKP